jgi:hypothetical protein
VKSLPDEIVRVRPVLSVGYALDQRQTREVSPDH